MAFEMRITPEEHVAQEIRALSGGDLEEYLSALLTCSVELTLGGVSLLDGGFQVRTYLQEAQCPMSSWNPLSRVSRGSSGRHPSAG